MVRMKTNTGGGSLSVKAKHLEKKKRKKERNLLKYKVYLKKMNLCNPHFIVLCRYCLFVCLFVCLF